AVVRFARTANVIPTDLSAQPATSNLNLEKTKTDDGASTGEWSSETDLQSAVAVALRQCPPGRQPHLVLMTDGQETRGDIRVALAGTAAIISTVPLPVLSAAEVLVSGFDLPDSPGEGEPFEGAVLVESTGVATVRVLLYANEFRISAQSVELQAGMNRIPVSDRIDKSTLYTAKIELPEDASPATAATDTFAQNNQATAVLTTSGKPSVLLVDRFPEQSQSIAWALKEEGIRCDVRPPEAIPESITDLEAWQAVLLSNVPATSLSESRMEVLRRYVSDSGGGLIMLGGEDSFGLGGYYRTAIEDILPVRCDFEKEQEKPSLAMVLVIDKSGSMGGQKIALAREAAVGAVELLGPRDQIGVIAFDGASYWISPLRALSDKAQVIDQISTIRPDGGTSLYPALRKAFDALQTTASRLKHVIVLTDGYSEPGEFDALTREMAAARMTVTTVGIGDADRELLEGMALTGRGRYYFTDDPQSIPRIFARETLQASQSAIQEEPFLPQLVRASRVLAGIDFESAPLLLGYVTTRPRQSSEVLLTTESGDPLLAWWRHGLGMTVAFTSDAGSRWAAEWAGWPQYSAFWTQLVRHCMRRDRGTGGELRLVSHGETAEVTLDAADSLGRFQSGLNVTLTVT
ncbi:MAG: VWA domain-containing protein, partial [Planctomycetaceae bacterium]|nr:VWA domain-containing protein [Planctomycetaceae bacterium]